MRVSRGSPNMIPLNFSKRGHGQAHVTHLYSLTVTVLDTALIRTVSSTVTVSEYRWVT